MSKPSSLTRFTVYQNQILKVNQTVGRHKFLLKHLQELQEWYGDRGVPYYSLVHEGIQFHEYVGVLQVKKTIYEILPFLNIENVSEFYWRDVLSYMLKVVGDFEFLIQLGAKPKKNLSILEPYFFRFLDEVEILLYRGLIKNYSQKEENRNNLKGKLIFSKHIQKNLIHKEKMFVRHISYSQENTLNTILFTALQWIETVSNSQEVKSKSKFLLSHFPKMPALSITNKLFSKIRYNRNTIYYKKAISIARFLLLKYMPGIVSSSDDTFSLLVDINVLWKKFIYKIIQRDPFLSSLLQINSTRTFLWESQDQKRIKYRNVLLFYKFSPQNLTILDAKWGWDGSSPNETLIKDLYIQANLLEAPKTILVIPSKIDKEIPSKFSKTNPQFKILLTSIFDRKADFEVFKENLLK